MNTQESKISRVEYVEKLNGQLNKGFSKDLVVPSWMSPSNNQFPYAMDLPVLNKIPEISELHSAICYALKGKNMSWESQESDISRLKEMIRTAIKKQ
jgi:hypothetical protein